MAKKLSQLAPEDIGALDNVAPLPGDQQSLTYRPPWRAQESSPDIPSYDLEGNLVPAAEDPIAMKALEMQQKADASAQKAEGMATLEATDPRFAGVVADPLESGSPEASERALDEVQLRRMQVESGDPAVAGVPQGEDDLDSVPLDQAPGAARPSDPFSAIFQQISDHYRQAGTYRSMSASTMRQTANKMADQMVYLDGLRKGGEASAMQELGRVREAHEEAQRALDGVRINPKRWEQATPALAQVFMGLASAAFSFFTGGRGVNPVVQLIDKAIDRDLKAQMTKADAVISKANLGVDAAETQAKLGATLRAVNYNRALSMLESVAKHGQTEAQIYGAMAAHEELKPKALQAMVQQHLTFSKAQGGAPKPHLKPDFISKKVSGLGAQVEGAQIMNDLLDFVEAGKQINPITGSGPYNKFVSLIFGSDWDPNAGSIEAQAASFATRMARATGVDVGNFAEKESVRFINAVKSKDWDAVKPMLTNIYNKMTQAYAQRAAEMQGLSQAYDVSTIAPAMQMADSKLLPVMKRYMKLRKKK